jgi:hypothetical protein
MQFWRQTNDSPRLARWMHTPAGEVVRRGPASDEVGWGCWHGGARDGRPGGVRRSTAAGALRGIPGTPRDDRRVAWSSGTGRTARHVARQTRRRVGWPDAL